MLPRRGRFGRSASHGFTASERGYVNFMKVWPSLLSLAFLLSACQLPAATGSPDVRRSPSVRPAALKPPATVTTAATAQGAVTAASKKLLVSAIHNALGATRASRLSSTLNETSGVIGNNGGNIVSDNGLGLISNNGGGIVSDNGLGYAVLQDGRLVSYTSETNDLVYFFTYTREGMSAKNGTMKIYEKKGYKSLPEAEREQALLDHFVWDDVSLDIGYKGAGTLAIAFPMRKVTSKRLPFVDGMTTRRIVRLNGLSENDLTTIGWQYDFALDIALLGGEKDKAQFTASAGEKDLIESPTSDGGIQSLPVRLDVTGKNATGTYTGSSEYAKHHATFIHTTTEGGAVTRIDFYNPPEGKNRMEVECVDAKLKVLAELDADNGGTGEVLSLAEPTPKRVATLKYDAEGLATITFEDGSELKARLF